MKKIVNGIEFDLTPEELSEHLQRENEHNAKLEKEKNNKYKFDRENEYPKTNELVIALWEKFMEHKNEPADLIQKKREEIKKKFPKGV